MSNRERAVEFALYFLVVIVTVLVVAYCATYRRTDHVLIQDRYWQWEVRVVYDEEHIRTRMDDDGNVHIYTETNTYTRCRHSRTGHELPPQSPGLPCKMWSGDRQEDSVYYRLIFDLEDGKQLDRGIPVALWDRLQPGAYRDVERDVFGNILALHEELEGG